jgi:hypothetical protein
MAKTEVIDLKFRKLDVRVHSAKLLEVVVARNHKRNGDRTTDVCMYVPKSELDEALEKLRLAGNPGSANNEIKKLKKTVEILQATIRNLRARVLMYNSVFGSAKKPHWGKIYIAGEGILRSMQFKTNKEALAYQSGANDLMIALDIEGPDDLRIGVDQIPPEKKK